MIVFELRNEMRVVLKWEFMELSGIVFGVEQRDLTPNLM